MNPIVMIAVIRGIPSHHVMEMIVMNIFIGNYIIGPSAGNAVIHKSNVVVINLHAQIIGIVLIQTPASVKHHIVVDTCIRSAEVDTTNLALIHRIIGVTGLIVEVKNVKIFDFDIMAAKRAYRCAITVILTGFIGGILY